MAAVAAGGAIVSQTTYILHVQSLQSNLRQPLMSLFFGNLVNGFVEDGQASMTNEGHHALEENNFHQRMTQDTLYLVYMGICC